MAEKTDRTRSAMGGSKPKKSKTRKPRKKKASSFKSMMIRRMSGADNPAYSITHDQHPTPDNPTPEPEEHGAPDEQALLDHVAQHAPNIGPPPPAPEPQQMA